VEPSTDKQVRGPAPRPCASCPYRRDVPSGIWHTDEYRKLEAYDGPTWSQPPNLFLCHQNDAGDSGARLCGGWVGCHGKELLALRIAAARGDLSGADLSATFDFKSPVPLFESGSDASAHGVKDIAEPGRQAQRAMMKIVGRRSAIRGG